MAEVSTWADVWGVTDLNDEDMEKIFIRPFNSVSGAVSEALKEKGADAKILFLMEGSITIPMIS